MISGRSKCVIRETPSPQASKKVRRPMPHAEFMQRIRKSLYFGGTGVGDVELDEDDLEISRPLAEYASELFSAPHKGHSLNRLNSVAAGSVHATTPCSLLMALIYLDRLNATDPGYVRRITPQELFIVSMMISTKFYAGHDESIYLSDWAEDGNMTEDRLKQLELEFLCAIDWNIYISNEQFFAKLSNVEKTLAQREGLRRGWLTYAELMQMLPSFTLAKFLLNNITVMAVSYAASVMTIAGAFFLASQIPGTALHRKTLAALTTPSTSTPQTLEAGAGVGGETLLESNAEEMSSRLHHLPGQHSLKVNASQIVALTSVAFQPPRNASCTALNVEAELLKLERQYSEEAHYHENQQEELRRRRQKYNQIADEIAPADWYGKPGKVSMQPHDTQRNWLALKAEFSDMKSERHNQAATFVASDSLSSDNSDLTEFSTFSAFLSPQQRDQNLRQPLPSSHFPIISDCFSATPFLGHNCTTAANFWHLLAAAAQQSLVRLPTLWFKFM